MLRVISQGIIFSRYTSYLSSLVNIIHCKTKKINQDYMTIRVVFSTLHFTMQVNAHNLFDAAAGFGGYKESGFGRDGGKEVSH